jgi:chromosome segregation ATPase
VAGCFAYAAWQIRTQQVELIDLRMEANRLRTMRDYSGDYAETLKDRNALREQLASLQGEKSATAQASNSREAELQRLIKFMQEELAAKNSLIEDLKNGKAVALPVEQPQPSQP